jgi:type I restriction enzyme, S subunit
VSFPRYSDYLASGLNWLGDVPGHWGIRRLGYYFGERREKVSDRDYQPLSVTKVGIVPQLETAAKTDDGDNRKRVCKGDFVINSRSDRKGSAGLSELDGSVSLISTVLKPKESVHGSFVHHLLRSVSFQEEFYRFGKGIVSDLWSTNYTAMSGITLAMPPFREQVAIATFLDHETAKIDALIAEQQRLIELLQEKRQAVISHAVTKGLNPDAPMKDSGVKWLGQLPEHWSIQRLKHISPQLTVGIVVNPSSYVVDEGLPFIYGGDIREGLVNWEEARQITPSQSEEQSKTKLNEGDLVVVRVGAPGVTAVVPAECEGGNCASVMLIRRGSFSSQWLCFVMNTRVVRFQVEVVQYGAAQEQFNIGHAVNFWVPVPPQEEQVGIAKSLNTETNRFDRLIAEAEQSISLLQERRSALISAAVTGQIDVRGLVPEASAA